VGTVFGPVIGATLFTFIHEILWAELTLLYMAIFGAVLMGLILFFPQGLLGWMKKKGDIAEESEDIRWNPYYESTMWSKSLER